MNIVSSELQQIRDEYAIPRRTEILDGDLEDVSFEDFIEKKDVLVSISNAGYIKRTDLSSYSTQNRGGKGKAGMSTLDDDIVSKIFVANTHSPILFFTNRGKVYRIKTYQLPETAPNARGRAFVNFIKIEQGDKLMESMSLPANKEEWMQYDLIFATKNGKVRRSSISDFENINANGKIAISLDENDRLIGVMLAKHTDNVLLATKFGMAIRFAMSDLRVIKSRSSDGVRGINLERGDEVISLCILCDNENDFTLKDQYLSIDKALRLEIWQDGANNLETQAKINELRNNENFKLTNEQIKKMVSEEQLLLTVTSNGYGKRTSAYEYRITGRGGKGIGNINLQGNASVVATVVANNTDEIIMIGTKGKVIRIAAKDISLIGRNTKGVKIFNLENGETIASISTIQTDDKCE